MRRKRVLESNQSIHEDVRRFCGLPDELKIGAGQRIAANGTSNDIFCALVFGRFEDSPPGAGPYRSLGRRLMSTHLEELLCKAYVEKTCDELALLRALVSGAATAGERAAAALEEQEAREAKSNQIRILRSHGMDVATLRNEFIILVSKLRI